MTNRSTDMSRSPYPTDGASSQPDLAARVVAAVASWPGVSAEPGEQGVTALMYEGEQLGHIHNGTVHADLPLPEPVRTRALDAGTVRSWFGGWVNKPIASVEEADEAVELFRAVYDPRRGAAAAS